jgi:uncharacterized membrane protein
MPFTYWVMVFCVSFLVYLLLDLVWLGYLAGPYYREKLDFFLTSDPRMSPAFLFYIFFVLGNVFFVTRPILESPTMREFLFRGGLYGLVTYGTYDLTNYATVRDWPLSVTILDLGWGIMISFLVSVSGYYTAVYLPYVT